MPAGLFQVDTREFAIAIWNLLEEEDYLSQARNHKINQSQEHNPKMRRVRWRTGIALIYNL